MENVTNPKSSNPKLSVKKENLQHLKVRTDLKGGITLPEWRACGSCHCTTAPFGAAVVINPVTR